MAAAIAESRIRSASGDSIPLMAEMAGSAARFAVLAGDSTSKAWALATGGQWAGDPPTAILWHALGDCSTCTDGGARAGAVQRG